MGHRLGLPLNYWTSNLYSPSLIFPFPPRSFPLCSPLLLHHCSHCITQVPFFFFHQCTSIIPHFTQLCASKMHLKKLRFRFCFLFVGFAILFRIYFSA
uniref:Uncharacterized protein n=1 Tax=Cucumis sativus TaxID=3659 RepID=A0A0A0KMC0_CUCSA